MQQKHAMIAIALIASGSDDNGSESMMEEAMAIKGYFIECGIISETEEYIEMLEEVESMNLWEEDDSEIYEKIKNSLPLNLRKTAFALAVKVVMADGEISDDEVESINGIGDGLEISQKDRDMIIDVLAILSDKPEE